MKQALPTVMEKMEHLLLGDDKRGKGVKKRALHFKL